MILARLDGKLKFKLPASAQADKRWWLREKEASLIRTHAWTIASWKIQRIEIKANLAKMVPAFRRRSMRHRYGLSQVIIKELCTGCPGVSA